MGLMPLFCDHLQEFLNVATVANHLPTPIPSALCHRW